MSAMTIRTDGRIQVAGLGCFGVHAIQRFLIVGRMAFLAGLVVRAGKLAFGFKVYGGVRVGFDGCMAGFAFDPGRAVYGRAEHFGRDIE